jgi:hypothetical protein
MSFGWSNSATIFFFVRLMGFVREHSLFRAAAAPPFLPPDAFRFVTLRCHTTSFHPLDLVEQQAARDKSIEPLLSRRLAFHPQLRGLMQ